MDGDYSKTPEFLDETELHDTGQYGWQRFRKPLLYAEELSKRRSSELISNSTSADAYPLAGWWSRNAWRTAIAFHVPNV
jgi:hypothetical protein